MWVKAKTCVGAWSEYCSPLQALSAVGRCQTFEASADGYGRGEGCAVLLFQDLEIAHPESLVCLVQVALNLVNSRQS